MHIMVPCQDYPYAAAGGITDPYEDDEEMIAPFLRCLRYMLEHESPEILRWSADGRSFEVLDVERMSTDVLPRYFKHRKYTSFQRQLNYFHFRKWTKSQALVSTFSNPYFLRDQPNLCSRIVRKRAMSDRKSPRSPLPDLVSSPPVATATQQQTEEGSSSRGEDQEMTEDHDGSENEDLEWVDILYPSLELIANAEALWLAQDSSSCT